MMMIVLAALLNNLSRPLLHTRCRQIQVYRLSPASGGDNFDFLRSRGRSSLPMRSARPYDSCPKTGWNGGTRSTTIESQDRARIDDVLIGQAPMVRRMAPGS